jgi:hypothetical protein
MTFFFCSSPGHAACVHHRKEIQKAGNFGFLFFRLTALCRPTSGALDYLHRRVTSCFNEPDFSISTGVYPGQPFEYLAGIFRRYRQQQPS